ncbi:DUF1647 domain-containing protein [Candidatus Actinomarina]|nr:DUF1647 domain-containing protein [Candidatus Actinomarina sp.]|tara:strand:+ start:25139 stop:26293 length:1155 start_codon:yes stop_codon:yes gene_type:complete
MMSYLLDILLIFKLAIKNIFYFKKKNSLDKFTLVTASDEKHYIYIKKFIQNYKNVNTDNFSNLIIYDLGLNSSQKRELKLDKQIQLRRFPFEQYPNFYSERNKEHGNKIGGFAWKPEIINILKNENITYIIWLDSATSFKNNLLYFKLLILERGFASFYSSGDIQKWTHDTVIEKLNLQASKRILHSSNLMAGVIGFDFTNEKARELLNDWNYLSSKKDFIFPPKSNSSNHRHDQSLLSIGYWELYSERLPSQLNLFGLRIQNWPNKILFFFDDNYRIKNKLLEKHNFNSTTTNSRCRIIILLNIESLKKIPLHLFFTKKILLFIFNENDKNVLKKHFIRNKKVNFYYISDNHNSDRGVSDDDYKFYKVNEIVEREYKIIAYEN